MKVSIITISFNSESTIEDTIRSVLAQEYTEIEYIIVDGGSSDGTQRIVERYIDRIAQFISEPDKGIYDGMNKGLALATGDLIGILNSDDVYADNTVISDVVSCIRKSDAEGLYADLDYVDRNDLTKVTRRWRPGPYRHGAFRKGWMPPHPTFFVKTEIYDRYGHFSTDLTSASDYELMLRFVHKHCIRIVYLPRVVIKMRTGGHSNVTLMNRIRANREDKRAWAMNGLRPGILTLVRKPLSKIMQFVN